MNKTSIIILHGWKLSTEKYQKLQINLSKKGYKVFIPDLPGFGKRVNINKIYTLDDYVNFVLRYIKKNNIHLPVLLGHSFGGRISLVVGAKYPSLIKSLVLTGVPGYLPSSKLKVKFFYYLAKIGQVIFYIWPLSIFADLARKILYRGAGAFDYYHTSGYLRETFKKIIRTDLTSYIKMIKIPTILVWGEQDVTTPVWIAQKMHTNIKNSKLVIVKGEGHNFVFENPSHFIKYAL